MGPKKKKKKKSPKRVSAKRPCKVHLSHFWLSKLLRFHLKHELVTKSLCAAKSPAPLTSCRTVPLRPTLLRIPVRRVDPCSLLLLLCLYVKDFPRRVRLSCAASGGMSRCNLPGENQTRVHLPPPTAFLTILTAVSAAILPIRATGHSSGLWGF